MKLKFASLALCFVPSASRSYATAAQAPMNKPKLQKQCVDSLDAPVKALAKNYYQVYRENGGSLNYQQYVCQSLKLDRP
jgi:hypothetical protein